MKAYRFTHAGLSILLLAILILGFIPLQTVQAVPLSWTDTTNMNAFRSNHTATPLMDGKVLVVGGLSGPLRTAELYNPAALPTPTWTFTGQMNSARANHTATLLADGRVLVVGGTNGTTPLSSAELYDPVSGTWTVTPPMSTSRYFHTATRLANGQVLVAGGVGVGSPSILTSAELYDPQTNSWSLTGSLNTRRNLHTATLLPNGQVLVVGGSSSTAITNTLKTAELYSPNTGTWQTVANEMTTQRYLHTATMLSNGKVLVVGGGNIVDGYLKSAELYDSDAGTWTATTNSMSDKRFAHAATLLSFLDGHESVLVSGGSSGGSNILASTELYDPVSDTWTTTGSLNHARMSHTATQLFDTQVLATGGSQSGNLSSAELYDPTPPLSAPETPVTISPNGNTNTEVSYLWNTSDGATSYELRVYTVSPVNKILDKIVDTSFCTAGVCTYHPANPLPVGAYYFQVSAGNGYTPGSYSIFSTARTFNTVANFNLSGNTGTGGVTLTYFDVKLRKAVSDGNGNYSIPVSYDWTGTVTPSKTGYIFDPPSKVYSTPVQSDLSGQDYTAIALLLTVTPAGNGLGTVTSNPGGIDCGADCSELYTFNTSVTLSATPDVSSLFIGWSGEGCSGTGTCTVSMTNARTVTATFTLKTFTLTVSPPTNGKVTSAPAGIDCGSDCSEIYNYGTVVTLTAEGATGYTLGNWGGDCSGISDCTLTIQSDKSVTATFAVAQNLTLTITGTGTGRVTSNPVKLNCTANCIVPFPQDTAVILTAHPAFGSIFIGWSGGLCSGTGTCSVTMSTARSVSAEFFAYNIIFLPLITR